MDCVFGTGHCGAHGLFDLGEELFDGIEVRAPSSVIAPHHHGRVALTRDKGKVLSVGGILLKVSSAGPLGSELESPAFSLSPKLEPNWRPPFYEGHPLPLHLPVDRDRASCRQFAI